MKKKITILMLAVMIILTTTLMITVNAADAIVALNPNKTKVNPGDTFTVILNAAYGEGIFAIETTLNYDKDKLELSNVGILNTLNWSLMNDEVEDGLNLAILSNSTSNITKADILKIEFKVKDTVSEGTTAKILLKDITIYGESENFEEQLGEKEIAISIVEKPTNPTPGGDEEENPGQIPGGNEEENPGQTPGGNEEENPQNKKLIGIEITKKPTKTTYEAGEKFDKTGMKVIAKYSDGTSKEITNYTIKKGNKLEEGQKSVIISYTEENIIKTIEQKITVVKDTNVEDNKKEDDKSKIEDIKQDNTETEEEEIPYTGFSSVVGIMIVVGIFGIISLVKYNKYKGI